MHINRCFPAVSAVDTRVLILGSFPGVMSLTEGQYYAHPRNSFWNIMAELLGFDNSLEYRKRIEVLKEFRVGLWDVMESCQRDGSLDSSIRSPTIITNDFKMLFRNSQEIKAVFFNGSRAEAEFKKRVVPHLGNEHHLKVMARLPSTSPAMATLSYESKCDAWRVITDYL